MTNDVEYSLLYQRLLNEYLFVTSKLPLLVESEIDAVLLSLFNLRKVDKKYQDKIKKEILELLSLEVSLLINFKDDFKEELPLDIKKIRI